MRIRLVAIARDDAIGAIRLVCIALGILSLGAAIGAVVAPRVMWSEIPAPSDTTRWIQATHLSVTALLLAFPYRRVISPLARRFVLAGLTWVVASCWWSVLAWGDGSNAAAAIVGCAVGVVLVLNLWAFRVITDRRSRCNR
jgi:hypothetical protein